MHKAKQPLYRKVNTTARGVHHNFGGDFRDVRHRISAGDGIVETLGMHKGVRRGLDYTPLFRFLLSRVGCKWDEVYSEAIARLDRKAPIFWLVALSEADEQAFVRTGEASYFSGLKVDADGILRMVDPLAGPDTLVPQCPCCTHTFNGVPFTRRYQQEPVSIASATSPSNQSAHKAATAAAPSAH
ncbi:hypothetical protein [Paucibacter sp. XJ19-41]|uniref:hypothetical protein n=1 Tax=Paucibacter sp. XJ19-41 TaxID=2927824 RepID=UPI002349B2FC|nr:hypothetical protein [Paucibacter sp. XJ19-41]MDC6170129.1 hypothetical protein [Paucibacter sp. XJ19-41]